MIVEYRTAQTNQTGGAPMRSFNCGPLTVAAWRRPYVQIVALWRDRSFLLRDAPASTPTPDSAQPRETGGNDA